MPVDQEWQLYDFDSVATGLVEAGRATISSEEQPVQVWGNFPTSTTDTPRVEFIFTVLPSRSNKQLGIVPSNRTEMLPDSVWDFTLACNVVTQREQSGALHREIIARCRLANQLYKLAQFGAVNPQYWPYHTIRELRELTPGQLSTDDEQTTDTTTLNFSGFFQIDADAWPVVRP